MKATMTRNKNKGKTKIDWDLNIFCPEQWYGQGTFWDPDLWKINARIYNDGYIVDTDYTITLLEKEAKALGLVDWAKESTLTGGSNSLEYAVFDEWLDAGLDCWLDLYHFNKMYRDRCSDRLLEFLDTLPQYLEDVPKRMTYLWEG